MSAPDGDTLFAKSLLTVARSGRPRDGGIAIGALSDWLQEQFDERTWVAVADPESTGFVLVVMKWAGNELPVRCALLMTEDPGDDERGIFADFGTEFREWFAENAHSFWSNIP